MATTNPVPNAFRHLFFSCVSVAILGCVAKHAAAQIHNDQTNQVIPGTQGITPGPGVDLSNWNTRGHLLEYAALNGINLTSASFQNSDLTSATFQASNLTSANFAGAIVQSVNFYNTASTGLTASQLYSTPATPAKISVESSSTATLKGGTLPIRTSAHPISISALRVRT
jgi:hypothetical protein